jgi:hypothetical protein
MSVTKGSDPSVTDSRPGRTRHADPIPWYRQFWPWFLIAIPVLGIAMAMITTVTAVYTRDVSVERVNEPVLDKTSWRSRPAESRTR